jgi:hypothetical protein
MDIFSSKPPDFGLSEIKNIVYEKFGLKVESKNTRQRPRPKLLFI